MASKVTVIDRDALAAMHTGSLMTRRKHLLACEESFALSDRAGHGVSVSKPGVIEFKDTPEWQQAYSDVKAELATREHVPNKQERKAQRQARAQQAKRNR